MEPNLGTTLSQNKSKLPKAVLTCSRMSGRTRSCCVSCVSFGVKSAGLNSLSLGEMPGRESKTPWQSTRTTSFHRHPENYPLEEVAAKDEKTHAHVVGRVQDKLL